jgi:hypothetical protein
MFLDYYNHQPILLYYNQGLEPVLEPLKTLDFCRVPGTGSGGNPKIEKGSKNRFWEP